MNTSPATQPFGAHRRCRAFTLVELLAALAVLVVMMFLLFRFISGAQQAWSAANARQEVYEKARVAMDLLTRDLQSAIACSDHAPGGFHIRFQQLDPENLRFVGAGIVGAEGPDDDSALSTLAEVGYQLDTANHTLDRACLWSCSVPGCTWDLYRDRSGGDAYFNHGTKFQEVIDGVLDLTFTSYTTAMAPQSSWLGAAVETA
ncbi:MAG: prepilin-type N-terminal cleavage/methylation domain-containing protein, partial [Lentisphaerae bacterium]|nr:prepilin-type N-terminal cleavage/methylation domain-containing protein [Lentisphaerota bacterium]